jgi:hypothetical protein
MTETTLLGGLLAPTFIFLRKSEFLREQLGGTTYIHKCTMQRRRLVNDEATRKIRRGVMR